MPSTTSQESPSTPELLLRTARPLFAEHGYEDTSIRRITREAGVNLGAVTYHFGSKEALYHEVLERALEPLQARIMGALDATGPAHERLDAAVEAFHVAFRVDPDLPGLLLERAMSGGPVPLPVRRLLGEALQKLAATVRAGKAGGELEAGDPKLTAACILGHCLGLSALPLVFGEEEGPGFLGRSLKGMESYSCSFVGRALRPA